MDKRWIQLGVAVALSLLALGWFVWQADWAALGEVLGQVDLPWIALASAILLLEFVIRAVRWVILMRPLGTRARVRDLWIAQIIGGAANTIFPFRAGEIAKAVVAARRTGHPMGSVVATAVMERVYDLFGLISVLLLMVMVLPPEGEANQGHLIHDIKLYGGAFGLAAFSCMVIFFALATRKQAARGAFERILDLAPPPARRPFLMLFDGFVAGLGNARDPVGLLQAGGLSVWMWFNGALAVWCIFQGMHMDLPFGAACFVGVGIALAVALPQAPGFLGTFHVAMQEAMMLWGQEHAQAQGFAIVFWAVSFVPVTAIGLVAMWHEGIGWRSIRTVGKQPPVAEASVEILPPTG